VEEGDTVKIYGDVRILFTVIGATPSVYVIDQGGVPVKAMDKFEELTLQG